MAWQILFALLLLVVPSLSIQGSNKDDWSIISKHCIAPTDLNPCRAPRRGSQCNCVFNKDMNKVRCCHVELRRLQTELTSCLVKDNETIHVNLSSINALFLSNCTADNDELHLFHFDWLENVETISLMEGNYVSLNNSYPKLNDVPLKKLKCMNLSGNALNNSKGIAETVNAIKTLKVLDLANNSLTYSPDLTNRSTNLWVHIAGNPKLKCDKIREAKQNNITFLFTTETWCTSQSSFDWFNSTDPINLFQIESRENIKKDCPANCSCTTGRLMYTVESFYTANVNCSGQQLTKLPEKLPYMTYTLIVDHNNITSLEPLGKNRNYEHVRTFYADHNQISSIEELEGSKFLQHFEILSLRNNNLQKLTLHVLSNVFERSWNSLHIFLGNNYVHCDCSTYHTFKTWLVKNKNYILDHNDIYCKNSNTQVLELRDTDVCLAQDSWHEYTYYLIVLEIALLILLISKVSYDYWVFKNAGYLPWPASKMPKLPCDCFLEK